MLEMGGMGKGRWEEEGKGGREVGVEGGGVGGVQENHS